MARSIYYPPANRSSQWFGRKYAGGVIYPNILVLHSTETPSWPGYSGGANAPTLTYHPGLKSWRQHFDLNRSARALVDKLGGVATNRGNVIQIELIGTCDKSYWNTWRSAYPDLVYWPEATDAQLKPIAEFIQWMDEEWPEFNPYQKVPRGWVRHPDSYGINAKQRLSFSEWDSFYGICGHQHVPENDHGDPGNINIDRVLSLMSPSVAKPLPDNKNTGGTSAPRGDVMWNFQDGRTVTRTLKSNEWHAYPLCQTSDLIWDWRVGELKNKPVIINGGVYATIELNPDDAFVLAQFFCIDVSKPKDAKGNWQSFFPWKPIGFERMHEIFIPLNTIVWPQHKLGIQFKSSTDVKINDVRTEFNLAHSG